MDWTGCASGRVEVPNVNKVRLVREYLSLSLSLSHLQTHISICPPLQMTSIAALLLERRTPHLHPHPPLMITEKKRRVTADQPRPRPRPNLRATNYHHGAGEGGRAEGGRPLGHFLSVADTAQTDGNRGYRRRRRPPRRRPRGSKVATAGSQQMCSFSAIVSE